MRVPASAAIAAFGVLGLLATIVPSAGTTRGLVVDATVTDDKGKPVENAVVSLTLVSSPGGGPAAAPAVMDQLGKEFTPHVLPVQVGAAVTFPNRDNIRHHVYSFSNPKRFELPLYIGTPAAPVVFDKPGVVVLGCNIHDWMIGYVYVLPTPYFARTGADGRTHVAGVPAGAYSAHVWHPLMRAAVESTTTPVTVEASQRPPLAFAVSLKRELRAPRGPGRYEGPQPGG